MKMYSFLVSFKNPEDLIFWQMPELRFKRTRISRRTDFINSLDRIIFILYVLLIIESGMVYIFL